MRTRVRIQATKPDAPATFALAVSPEGTSPEPAVTACTLPGPSRDIKSYLGVRWQSRDDTSEEGERPAIPAAHPGGFTERAAGWRPLAEVRNPNLFRRAFLNSTLSKRVRRSDLASQSDRQPPAVELRYGRVPVVGVVGNAPVVLRHEE